MAWISSSSRAIAVVAIATTALTVSLIGASMYVRKRRQLRREAEGEDASRCCSTELEAKPQYQFKRVLADNSFSPFKHHMVEDKDAKEKEISIKMHPYEDAITSLMENPPQFPEFVASDGCPHMDSSFVWVDTVQQLELLVQTLEKEKTFAVDTEQHSLRSFLGFTALLQISTQKEDFLVDTIALHDVMGLLRPVFSDPSIFKVFHGAGNDILWLQRDFHLYVVNLFDTAKACGVLSKPHKSLAYLLKSYCGVITNKMLQREDWRIRPLSAAMVNYARTDAHYLLFIAKCLISELKDQSCASEDDSVYEAYRRSNTICLQLYVKDEAFLGNSAVASIFTRHVNTHESSWKNDHTRELIGRLCAWRDLMARIHDESLRYVLSDQAIASLSQNIPAGPSSIRDVIVQTDLSNNTLNAHLLPSPSPIVEGHMEDICYIFKQITENSDDVFRKILERYLNQKLHHPLSIYNYRLLSELNIKLMNTLFPEKNGSKVGAPAGRKASRQLFVQKFSCKSPVYHNCRIFASDGRLLCYCDRRKLEWYLRRNLAKIIEDDPPAIVLLFEPKGRPEDEDNEFYIQSKKNICVGCGEENHYLRYRIIPSCYRMHFPEHLKSHRSHDIVLLCVDCHEIAHAAAEKYKRQVAAEFGIPLFVKKVVESSENEVLKVASSTTDRVQEGVGVSPLQLRTAAMALVRHGSKMPPKRQEELKLVIKEYFGGREITEDDLEKALLVGMSLTERRKLERKRGLTFRSSENHTVCSTSDCVVEESFKCSVSPSNGLPPPENTVQILVEEKTVESENICFSERDEYNIHDQFDYENGSSHEKVHSPSTVSTNHYSCASFETVESSSCICSTTTGNSVNINLSKESGNSSSLSHKCTKKLSLLGHGPHGREVVEKIFHEKGEDGILTFCQRWRQIFVESVNPRFLPAGWDIRHSGKRDFGRYSVYNPKKASET